MPSKTLPVVQRAAPPHTIKFFDAGELEFGGTISTPTVDRYGDIVESSGCRYKAFLATGTILGQHDAYLPVATPIDVDVRPNRVHMSGLFPQPGVSEDADKYRRLVKARVLNSFSIGFLPLRAEPLRGGGVRYLEWELVEVSIVSVPALSEAVISERSLATKRIFDLGAHRYARDLKRAGEIASRIPPDREANLEKVRRIRARLGMTPLASDAERYAAEQLRRRDRAAAGDAVMRFGTQW